MHLTKFFAGRGLFPKRSIKLTRKAYLLVGKGMIKALKFAKTMFPPSKAKA